MSSTQKEKLETGAEASLQVLVEECVINEGDNFVEVSLKKRKKDAGKPLYLKRI